EHFGLDLATKDKTVEQVCLENLLNKEVFVAIANLYNGFNPEGVTHFEKTDAGTMIAFLARSHQFYLNEKLPEIQSIIDQLLPHKDTSLPEIKLIDVFFKEYRREVEEHLSYEDEVAFPYFLDLLSPSPVVRKSNNRFSADQYQDHHTDIETKLNELKKLLVRHISLKENLRLRRKLLINLFELEDDLNVHSMIEESMLIPLIKKIEKDNSREPL
ncbi:MAG: hemerythrin domain-containing protein, partial [Mangrovibacterium sp.]